MNLNQCGHESPENSLKHTDQIRPTASIHGTACPKGFPLEAKSLKQQMKLDEKHD